MNTLKEINGKYYQQCKVVMLPTDQKAQLHSITKNNDRDLVIRVKTETQALFCNRSIESGIRKVYHLYLLSDDEIKEGDWFYDSEVNKTYQQSGILSDRVVMSSKHSHYINNCKKIIATTDKSIRVEQTIDGIFGKNYLPFPSDSFIQKYIEEYNKGKPITDVLVKYTYNLLTFHTFQEKVKPEIRVNKDNTITITIKKVKDSYSREEVEKLCREAFQAGCKIGGLVEKSITTGEDHLLGKDDVLGEHSWIKENL